MNARHSAAYERLARLAGKQVGLKDTAAKAVAANDQARPVRDGLWAEYERMLRDVQTYTIEGIVDLQKQAGCLLHRSAVHRDRRALTARESALRIAADRARAVLEAARAGGVSDLLAGGEAMAAQIIFAALSDLDTAALDDLSATQIIKMIEAFSKLRRSAGDAELIAARKAEIVAKLKRFDEQAAAAQRSSSDGRISPAQLEDIRKAVFGASGGSTAQGGSPA